MTLRPARQLQALIFYAGDAFRADFQRCLSHIADELNACRDVSFCVALHVTEIDLLKGGSKLILADPAARDRLLAGCRSLPSIIVVLPAYRSFQGVATQTSEGPSRCVIVPGYVDYRI